jgi:serine/threonine-protein kinase
MGDVYLAKDTQLPRQVAIKTIRQDLVNQPEICKRIERECQLHAKIGSHPNIVTLHDRVEYSGSICLVMEYVPGQTLQLALEEGAANGTPLDWTESVRIAGQCLEALGRIHAHGIVHRDVKPANILLGKDDAGRYVAKLMDFGIARLATDTDGMTILTQEGSGGPGTPVYMAPEQIDSKKYGHVSPATDVYAMGIVLYQMLSGKPPFTGSLTEVFSGHLTQAPPPLSADGDSDPGYADLEQVIRRALTKNPLQRYRTAQEFHEALENLSPVALIRHSPAKDESSISEASVNKTVVASDPHLVEPAREKTLLDGTGGTHRGRRSSLRVGPAIAVVALLLLGVAGTFGALQYVRGEESSRETADDPGNGTDPVGPETTADSTDLATQEYVTPPMTDDARPLPGPDFSDGATSEDSKPSESTGSALDALRERRNPDASVSVQPATTPEPPEPAPAPATPVVASPAQSSSGGNSTTVTSMSTTTQSAAPEPDRPSVTAVKDPPRVDNTGSVTNDAEKSSSDDPLAGFDVVDRSVTKR